MNSSDETLNRYKTLNPFADKLAANVITVWKQVPRVLCSIIIMGGLVLTNINPAFAEPGVNMQQIPQAQTFNVPQTPSDGAFGNGPSFSKGVPAGTVTGVKGDVRVIHANGSVAPLKVGDFVYPGDVIVRAANSSYCIQTHKLGTSEYRSQCAMSAEPGEDHVTPGAATSPAH